MHIYHKTIMKIQQNRIRLIITEQKLEVFIDVG